MSLVMAAPESSPRRRLMTSLKSTQLCVSRALIRPVSRNRVFVSSVVSSLR